MSLKTNKTEFKEFQGVQTICNLDVHTKRGTHDVAVCYKHGWTQEPIVQHCKGVRGWESISPFRTNASISKSRTSLDVNIVFYKTLSTV